MSTTAVLDQIGNLQRSLADLAASLQNGAASASTPEAPKAKRSYTRRAPVASPTPPLTPGPTPALALDAKPSAQPVEKASAPAAASRPSTSPADAIRKWAWEEGLDVGVRGRIKQSVTDAYYAAQAAKKAEMDKASDAKAQRAAKRAAAKSN